MEPINLANRIRDYLEKSGSIDVRTLDKIQVDLQINRSGAVCGVSCNDKDLIELCEKDTKLSDLSISDEDVFALPYRKHIMLIFDTRDQE